VTGGQAVKLGIWPDNRQNNRLIFHPSLSDTALEINSTLYLLTRLVLTVSIGHSCSTPPYLALFNIFIGSAPNRVLIQPMRVLLMCLWSRGRVHDRAKQDDEHLPRPIQTDSNLRALDGAIALSPQPYRLIFTLLRATGCAPTRC
jgi:hypothetical protein